MELQEYRTMFELENHYWWFVARRDLVAQIVREEASKSQHAKIFDVGCGTGANLTTLRNYGESYGIDMQREAILYCRERGINDLAISRIEQIPYLSESFDVITALDVLEHIDDDLKGMEELYRICKPGGMLLVTVPAYGFLWSEHDEALHHRRRYAAHELRNKLSLLGFQIERCSYFITFLFFPILLIRIMNGIFKKSTHPQTSHISLPEIFNKMLIWLLAFEAWLFKFINLPFGVSIVCTARKPLNAINAAPSDTVVPINKYSRIA